MSELFFSINNQLDIQILSNQALPFSQNELLLMKAYVPGLRHVDKKPKKIDFTIKHIESSTNKLAINSESIVLHEKWNGQFSTDLYHLLYGVVRLLFLKQQVYSVHAACLGRSKRQILVVGHSGSGKTTSLIKLMKHADIKIFSGNKTLVKIDNGRLKAVAGSSTITIKESDKQLLKGLDIDRTLSYWNRLAFSFAKSRYVSELTVPIQAIALIKLNDADKHTNRLNETSALHTLYPFFLDTVNADIVLAGIGSVFPGTASSLTKKHLATDLRKLLNELPVYSIAGPADYVADQLYKL